MDWFYFITFVLSAWAMLRVLGGERERQLQAGQVQAAINAAVQAAAAKAEQEPPTTRSSVNRLAAAFRAKAPAPPAAAPPAVAKPSR